jgi:hypothetical protein
MELELNKTCALKSCFMGIIPQNHINLLFKISILKWTHKFIVAYVHCTQSLSQGLTQNNNMKSWKGKYEFKAPNMTFYILESQ